MLSDEYDRSPDDAVDWLRSLVSWHRRVGLRYEPDCTVNADAARNSEMLAACVANRHGIPAPVLGGNSLERLQGLERWLIGLLPSQRQTRLRPFWGSPEKFQDSVFESPNGGMVAVDSGNEISDAGRPVGVVGKGDGFVERARSIVALFRRIVADIPSDPIDFSATQDEVRERYRRLGARHDQMIALTRKHYAEYEQLHALRLRYVPDAEVPRPCGSSMDEIAIAGEPFSNFSQCFDFCEQCRSEANRLFDLIDAGVRAGRPTELFIPVTTAQARIAAASLEAARLNAQSEQNRIRSAETASAFGRIKSVSRQPKNGSNGNSSSAFGANQVLVLNLKKRSVSLGDLVEVLSERAAAIVRELIVADGANRTGDELKEFKGSSERPDRIIQRMPQFVRDVITVKKGVGYHLKVKGRVDSGETP